MNENEIEYYLKAGEIADKVMKYVEEIFPKVTSVLHLAEEIENKIKELGGELAFPVNISINDVAAHFTPDKNDKTEIRDSDYVKIDIGVHVNGFIADTARTFRKEGKDDLIKCSEEMLKEALKIVGPGVEVKEIGKTVFEVAQSYGFNSVSNLTGHGLDRFELHAGITIPNIPYGKGVLERGKAYAIEPFCTDGQGSVKDSDKVNIFMVLDEKFGRIPETRKILEFVRKYNGLPFAKRWIENELNINPLKLNMALRELVNIGSLHPFYVLKEISGGNVAQTERTVLITEDGDVKITTNW